MGTIQGHEQLPESAWALQLTAPGVMELNTAKPLPSIAPYQILGEVETVGLCFSDLKLLTQFTEHPRKAEVTSGLSPEALSEMSSYVPGELPAVPGHEVVLRIVAVGSKVSKYKVGDRCLVQADYRDLRTPTSNAAFGYNFEGGLQEYVAMDERVVVASDGTQFLIPVGEQFSASSIALVEPWACVENSYATRERQCVLEGGKLLLVAEKGRHAGNVANCFGKGAPAEITVVGEKSVYDSLSGLSCAVVHAPSLEKLPNESYDDIIYLGSSGETIESLDEKLAKKGIINIVLGGDRIDGLVSVGVGRVHYAGTRWIGTVGDDPSESYAGIPSNGEVRPSDDMLVVGAAGPMGQMHVLRALSLGFPDLSVTGSDFDDSRLASLHSKADKLAAANGCGLRLLNPKTEGLNGSFDYVALMAPLGALVQKAIEDSNHGALINIFAGIPAPVRHEIDLQTYIERGVFMFGTSGSTIDDMKRVLEKVETGKLNTDYSVSAVAGMRGAADGIEAVKNMAATGKIMVYPRLRNLPYTPLSELAAVSPEAAAALDNGTWTIEAEKALLESGK